MEKKRAKTGIKIGDTPHQISRHTLDLKNGGKKEFLKKEERFLVSQKRGTVSDELLIVGVFKTISFFPKKIFSLAKCLFFGLRNATNFRGILHKILQKVKFSRDNRKNIKQKDFAPSFHYAFNPPQYWFKGVAVFVALAFLFVLPIKVFSSFDELEEQKDAIIAQSLSGYEQLKNSDFDSASISFASAKATVDDLGFAFKHLLSAVPVVGEKLSFGNGLLIFGENFSKAAAILKGATEYFNEDVVMIEKVKNLQKSAREAIPYLLASNSVLQALENHFSILPVDLNPFKEALGKSTKALLVFENFSDTLLEILGEKHFKRYLVVFQNNNEIRPTGGFIGSFAIIDIDRGEIKNIEIPGGGSYDIQGQLKELVISPEPFHLINSTWQFQDSNWFPDFPTSAKKIMWFYEKSGGSSVDGVVAVNATLMEDLLGLIGPVDMSEYGRVMTEENFIEETQKIVELEYDKEINKPKQVIADMAPKVLDSLLKMDAEQVAVFSDIVHRAILDKDILVYSKDEEIEKNLETFGLSGKLKDISGFTDYLMVIDTNIAGQKTDGRIFKEIRHFSKIEEDGSIINTVQIVRRHTGEKGALFSGVRNVNYLRLYVPQGSELISTSGFKAPPGELFEAPPNGYAPDKDLARVQGAVYVEPTSGTRVNNEFGRTVFGNWIMVDPGQEVVVSFKYKLPYKLSEGQKYNENASFWGSLGFNNNFSNYTILIEKQPGAKNTTYKNYVSAEGKKAVARIGEGVALLRGGWQYEAELNSDKYYGVVLE